MDQIGGRDTANDGRANKLELLLTTRGAPVWNVIQAVPPVRGAVNKVLTNLAILKVPTRPNPYSTMADYTSWTRSRTAPSAADTCRRRRP